MPDICIGLDNCIRYFGCFSKTAGYVTNVSTMRTICENLGHLPPVVSAFGRIISVQGVRGKRGKVADEGILTLQLSSQRMKARKPLLRYFKVLRSRFAHVFFIFMRLLYIYIQIKTLELVMSVHPSVYPQIRLFQPI